MEYFNILLFIIICLSLRINSEIISNENEFLKIISGDKENLELHIKNEINFNDNVNINKSFNKISIIGNSTKNSKLNFINLYKKLSFSEKVNEIEIINLSITGNVYFNNSKKITINNVSIKGYINSNFDKINNENVKISNFIYNTSNYSSNVCVNLGGNVEIENSKFYGSSSCQERLFDFNGLDKYKLSIKNSYFSGEYGCPCLQVNNSTNSYIEDSIIEKAFSPYGSTGG